MVFLFYRSSGVKSKVNKLRAAFNSREADQVYLNWLLILQQLDKELFFYLKNLTFFISDSLVRLRACSGRLCLETIFERTSRYSFDKPIGKLCKTFSFEIQKCIYGFVQMLRFEEVSALNHPQKRIEGMKILIAELPECNR